MVIGQLTLCGIYTHQGICLTKQKEQGLPASVRCHMSQQMLLTLGPGDHCLRFPRSRAEPGLPVQQCVKAVLSADAFQRAGNGIEK